MMHAQEDMLNVGSHNGLRNENNHFWSYLFPYCVYEVILQMLV